MSSTAKGTRFEDRIAALLESDRIAQRLPWQPECCRVFSKKPYYSRDREKDIVFDVAVEAYWPGSDAVFMTMLVECKDLGRPVGVDDVEEFFAKVQQVGAARTKAIIATTTSFQAGAIAFARSKGIGLVLCLDDSQLKWVLQRTPGGLTVGTNPDRLDVHRSLAGWPSQSANLSKWNCCFGDYYTTKLHEFLVAVAGLDEDERAVLGSAELHVEQAPLSVERLHKRDIEIRVQEVLAAVAYTNGCVRLEDVCGWQCERNGLEVRTDVAPTLHDLTRGVLGRIHFDRNEIVILVGPEARQKFTLAHELGHLLLGHNRYFAAEYCERSDFEQRDGPRNTFDPIRRIEWQANYFASCLLLPRVSFLRDFFRLAERHNLQDRGHGWLYVDNQRINQHLYKLVTSELRSLYLVSRRAVTLRLKDLGVLQEAPPLRPLCIGSRSIPPFAGGVSERRLTSRSQP